MADTMTCETPMALSEGARLLAGLPGHLATQPLKQTQWCVCWPINPTLSSCESYLRNTCTRHILTGHGLVSTAPETQLVVQTPPQGAAYSAATPHLATQTKRNHDQSGQPPLALAGSTSPPTAEHKASLSTTAAHCRKSCGCMKLAGCCCCCCCSRLTLEQKPCMPAACTLLLAGKALLWATHLPVIRHLLWQQHKLGSCKQQHRGGRVLSAGGPTPQA